MKKINFLILTLVLIFASGVSAQDKVFEDFDRTGWKADAPAYSPKDGAVGNAVADAKYLLDDLTTTFLALVKPGKTYDGITGPATIQELGFTIDMGEAKVFDYFRYQFRTNNQYHYLRPFTISIYGSNDPAATFLSADWTSITDRNGARVIRINPDDGGASVTGEPYSSENIELDNATAFKFIKVVFESMSSNSGGSTLHCAEFYVGKTTDDKVIEKSKDISFGDIMAGFSAEKTLAIKGYNLNTPLSYTLKGDDAPVFSAVAKEGAFTSTGDTAIIKFSPTAKKLYTAELIINMPGVVEPDTIVLTGNADFDLPVEISSVDTSNEHWYYIQFERQAIAGTVLAKAATAGDPVKQLPLTPGDNNQLWKVTGTWDNYKVVNKAGQELLYTYMPEGEDVGTGLPIPEVNSYVTGETGDAMGFVRYQSTESWQLVNISSEVALSNKLYLTDISGADVGGGALNNAGAQLKFIGASVPSFVIPGDLISLGSVRKGASGDFTVAIGGLNLTNPISVALSGDEDQVFTLKTSSLPAAGGTIELSYAPVAYKKRSEATITLTSGSLSESFVVSATSDVGISKYYLGTEEQWGTRDDGEIVSTLPALKAEDEVWIATGEYTTGQITVVANVQIYGGFYGTETSPDERARVAGGKPWEFLYPSVLKNSASLVMSVTGANAIIDGITFEGTSTVGRAIQNTNSAATNVIIRNNIMKGFNSNADGGAMNIRYKTEIYDCLITGNRGNKGGGGYLDGVVIHDCEITNNSAPTTAANSIGNVNGGGGGLLVVASEVYNCYFAGNEASFGGGVFPRTTSKVYNCIIVENKAKSGSGVSFDERDTGVMVYNVIVANNHSTEAGGSGVNFAANTDSRIQKLYNSILWNNTDQYDYVYEVGVSGSVSPTPEIKNVIIDDLDYYASDINPNLVIIDGIAETDPVKLFTDYANGDWTTASTSPGINKGLYVLTEEVIVDDEIVTPETTLEFAGNIDYLGNMRIYDGTIDIGPYEYGSTPQVSIENPDVLVEGNVISTHYFNIQGVEVNVPTAKGVYIKKEVLDTNQVRVTKVLYTGNGSGNR